MGTGDLAQLNSTVTVTVGCAETAALASGVLVDLECVPPQLQLQFPQLNFAQRTARTLLSRLDLPFLVSMWNAAERVVAETIGADETAAAQDLITWQMLRKNFASHTFSITEEEHVQLQRKVKEFHQHS